MSEISFEETSHSVIERLPSFREVLSRHPRPSHLFTLYVLVRMKLNPYEDLARLLPPSGSLLDVGCGFGLWLNYLALRHPDLRLEGIDPDPRKISVATSSSDGVVEFRLQQPSGLSGGEYDAVTIVDVLYLVDPEGKRQILRECSRALRPGGLLLLKEVDVKPWWKFWPSAL